MGRLDKNSTLNKLEFYGVMELEEQQVTPAMVNSRRISMHRFMLGLRTKRLGQLATNGMAGKF